MKITAQAPANIAFIKYWGKADAALRLPRNDSFSMNLDGAYTTTSVEFLPTLTADEIVLSGGEFSDKEKARMVKHLDCIRELAHITMFACVMTENTFPKSTGIASSASGFAALTVAACFAAGLSLSERELSILARIGSGSACRSIPDGFVLWHAGASSDDSYAESLYPASYWDLQDILLVVSREAKKVSTTEGHEAVETSPLWGARMEQTPKRMERIRTAMQNKNFQAFGEVIEEDCLDMHAVMQTQTPPLMYWTDTTRAIMSVVSVWRETGLAVYFTIDAGPNVHLICEAKDEGRVLKAIKAIKGIQDVIVNKPAGGARII